MAGPARNRVLKGLPKRVGPVAGGEPAAGLHNSVRRFTSKTFRGMKKNHETSATYPNECRLSRNNPTRVQGVSPGTHGRSDGSQMLECRMDAGSRSRSASALRARRRRQIAPPLIFEASGRPAELQDVLSMKEAARDNARALGIRQPSYALDEARASRFSRALQRRRHPRRQSFSHPD